MSFDEIQTSTSSISYTEWNAMVKEIRHNDKSNCSVYINDDETYVGAGAGANITAGSGINNTLIGHDAGNAVTTGDGNVFVGYEAGKLNNQTATTGIGYQALTNNTGLSNTAIGYASMDAVNTGGYNTAVGYGSLSANTSGARNVSIGYYNLLSNTEGTMNVSVGDSALYDNTTGDNNTAVGFYAGENATATLDGCVYLGYYAGQNNTTANTLYINNGNSAYPLIMGYFSTGSVNFGNSSEFKFKFGSAGQMYIKETTTPTKYDSYGCIYTKADNKLYFQDGAGAEHTVAFV